MPESPETLELDYKLGTSVYVVGSTVWTHNAEYVVTEFVPKLKLVLTRKDVFDKR